MKKNILILLAFIPAISWAQSLVSTGNDTIYVKPGTVVSSVSGVALNGTGNSFYSLPQGTDLYNVAPSSKRVLIGNPNARYEIRNVANTVTANFYTDVNYLGQTPVADFSIQNANSTGSYLLGITQTTHIGYNDIPVEWNITRTNGAALDMHNLVFQWGNELEPSQIPVKRLYVYDQTISDWIQLPSANTSVDEFSNTLVFSGFQGDLSGTRFIIAQAKPVLDLSGMLDTVIWCAGTASSTQSFLLQGSSLINDVTVYAPANFQISFIPQGPFYDSLVISPVGNSINPTVLYIHVPTNAVAAGSANVLASYNDVFYVNISDSLLAVSVADPIIPTITAPVDITIAGNSSCQASGVALGLPVTSDNCGVASVTNDAPAIFSIGTTAVTWTVTDNSGNIATAIQNVTVTDGIAPTITCNNDTIVSNDAGLCGAVVTFSDPTATDNCSSSGSGTEIYYIPFSQISNYSGTYGPNCNPSTMDVYSCGNDFGITWTSTGTTVPTSVSIDFYQTYNNSASVNSLFNGIADGTYNWFQSPCVNNVTSISLNPNSYVVGGINNFILVGSSMPGCVVWDENPDPTWSPSSYAKVTVNYSSGLTITQTDLTGLTSGDLFPVGTTTLEYTATDSSGNTSTCSFDITVNDTESPAVTAPADVTVSANSSCNAFGVVLGTPTATDNCTIVSTTNDAPATFPLGTTVVTWTVTDNSGNATTVTQ
ncbi:MAG: HYR domain-containing protein, partial [Crocinitomicaceae bacterium]